MFKKWFVPLGGIIILVAFSLGYYTLTEKKQAASYKQPYYIALGDSIAAGMGVPPHMGYTDDFYNFLLTKDIKTKYLNLGHGGDTTADLLRVINNNRQELAKATIITVNIGINDVFERLQIADSELSPSEIRDTYQTISTNLNNIVNGLREATPDAEIIILNYYNPFPGDKWFDSHVKYLNNIIKDSAEKNKLTHIDIYALFLGTQLEYLMKEDYEEDPIHPNLAGYKAMADLLIQKY